MQSRRDFVKVAACSVGALAVGNSLGNVVERIEHPVQGDESMDGFVAPVYEKIRVGVIGVGGRGSSAAMRLSKVPGVEITALCELVEEKAVRIQQQLPLKPKLFIGPEEYKRMCDSGICDVVHINTNWESHAQIAIYALNAGVHAMVEVPGCRTVDEAWELVETSEKRRVNCMLLANCCYGEDEMTLINMARRKIFDDLYHAEGCYLHETRTSNQGQAFLSADKIFHSLDVLRHHTGAQYPLHALGPISLALGINRGDQFDYLVSMGSKPFGWQEFARRKFGEDAPVSKLVFEGNDFNSTLINTKNGKTILIRQCNNSPMPYTRINTLYGFKGTVSTNPLKVSLEEKIDTGVGRWPNEEETAKIRSEYGHQLWKLAGEFAKKIGGHGGMDYLMDFRWAYCLRNGLPLDTNVYDLAAWSSIIELSEKSVRNRSVAMDIPDFKRGKWKSNNPLGDWYTDPSKTGFK